jgi:hypothetical protein
MYTQVRDVVVHQPSMSKGMASIGATGTAALRDREDARWRALWWLVMYFYAYVSWVLKHCFCCPRRCFASAGKGRLLPLEPRLSHYLGTDRLMGACTDACTHPVLQDEHGQRCPGLQAVDIGLLLASTRQHPCPCWSAGLTQHRWACSNRAIARSNTCERCNFKDTAARCGVSAASCGAA